MRVLLIQPPIGPKVLGPRHFALCEPLGLELIAACIPQHDIQILDMRLEDGLIDELAKFRPDIVGISVSITDTPAAIDIAGRITKLDSKILIVVGGYHPTTAPYDLNNKNIDVLVLGEGEIAFAKLIAACEKGLALHTIPGLAFPSKNGLYFTQPRELIVNLDSLPFPARYLTKRYRKMYYGGTGEDVATMQTSRGCPHRCSFCSLWKFAEGKYRIRSAESVVSELAKVEEHYVEFVDDNMFEDSTRVQKIAQLINIEGIEKSYKVLARSDTVVNEPNLFGMWKEIGLKTVVMGFESYNNKELVSYNKETSVEVNLEALAILKGMQIDVIAYFIINPKYTEKDFKELKNFVRSVEIEYPIFSVLTPLPGTEFYEKNVNKLTSHNYEEFDFAHAVLPTTLPKDVFQEEFLDLYKEFYSANMAMTRSPFYYIRPEYILDVIK